MRKLENSAKIRCAELEKEGDEYRGKRKCGRGREGEKGRGEG